MITKCTALQLAPKGIRVNSVNPGPVLSNILRDDGMKNLEQNAEFFAKYVPLKFMAQGTDIAPSVAFLANNEKARNISGTIFINDSGVMLDPGCMGNVFRNLH